MKFGSLLSARCRHRSMKSSRMEGHTSLSTALVLCSGQGNINQTSACRPTIGHTLGVTRANELLVHSVLEHINTSDSDIYTISRYVRVHSIMVPYDNEYLLTSNIVQVFTSAKSNHLVLV